MKQSLKMPRKKNRPWSIPKIWDDETVFIIGGGPSLLNMDLEGLKDRRVIGVNNSYGDRLSYSGVAGDSQYMPRDWVDICWFGDKRWFFWHKKCLKYFGGLIATCGEKLKDPMVLSITRGKSMGIDPDPRRVSWNKSSGGSAINFAYHLGAKRIVLVGFDMRPLDISEIINNKEVSYLQSYFRKGGQIKNYHPDHPSPNKDPYERFLKAFHFIRKDARKLGVEIINATPGSALSLFPIVPLEELING